MMNIFSQMEAVRRFEDHLFKWNYVNFLYNMISLTIESSYKNIKITVSKNFMLYSDTYWHKILNN